jgi:vacuolar-type H+-ATPase catalytic subunit A/Vma1
LVPPGYTGEVVYIAPEGPHTIEDEICTLDMNGTKKKFTMV